MGLINLLTSIFLPSFGNLGDVSVKYKWICDIIGSLIGFVGDVGLGIIVFTIILKLITLPLDIYSRASTKKNSLKMEMMKDDLEKLKKQYKNNEQLYQQKMMSLYKKNGYSAFSACLPTIVTLIFFIIVIGAFNSYSRVADKDVFNQMGIAYDNCLDSFVNSEEKILVEGEGAEAYKLNINYALKKSGFSEYFNEYSENEVETVIENYTLNVEKFLEDEAGLMTKYPELANFVSNGKFDTTNKSLINRVNAQCHEYILNNITQEEREYLQKQGIVDGIIIKNVEEFIKIHTDLKEFFNTETKEIKYDILLNGDLKDSFERESAKYVCSTALKLIGNDVIENEVKYSARKASASAYEDHASRSVIFPWVKNLWVVDSPFKSALPSIEELETSLGAENIGSLKDETVYNELTYNLSEYKKTGFKNGNGWFILVALSILTMLGSTIIMNKQQKTQMQLSSVNGENSQAAATQKMMTWMMPIMFGVFAFIYSAAFSIYMITSSLLSTGFTLLINYLVEKSFKNKILKEEQEKASKPRYGKRRD